ncbi:hypothetical protein KQI76_07155 [Amphibacillus sp. MSJ-3]|nr:hypothetical protein [Amphibacillus sp. MSJ-3]
MVWDGAKTFVGEVTGYYDTIRATTGVDPVTGVEYTAGQRIAYAGLAAAGFIPFVGWAGRALRGSKGIYATVKGVKALDTSLDIYKAANAFSMIKQVEMGLYGLAAANGFSDAITGRDIFGNALNAEQRSASLMQGIGASIPFVPSAVKQGKYMTNQALETISNMNLTQGSNGFRIFGQNQGGLQRWLGNKHIQPAFAGSVPEVPIRVMDTKHVNKMVDHTYFKGVGGGSKGTGNVKHLDDVPRIKEVEVNFKRNDKHDSEEFARQLKDQEKGMNELTVNEYLKNREKYIEQGRAIEGNAAQQAAREEAYVQKINDLQREGLTLSKAKKQAKEWLDTQAALHNPDQIAGGKAELIGGLGDKRINSSIGSQWRYRIDIVDEQIKELAKSMTPEQLKNTYLNVKLTH